jgi:hypothetical protein
MSTRRSSLVRRSALTAVAASALVALTAPAGPSAAAARSVVAPAAPVVTTSIADVRLPSATVDHATAVKRAGSCDVAMTDL